MISTKRNLTARTDEIRPTLRVGFSLLSLTSDFPVSLTSDFPVNEDSIFLCYVQRKYRHLAKL